MTPKDEDERALDQLSTLFEEGGAGRVVSFIQGTADPEQRRKLHGLVRRALPERSDAKRSLDDVIRIARVGIAEGLRQAELARARSDTDEARECIDFANRLSYNLAADLAECWPGDDSLRERRHFEAGLRAAYDCIVWRQELGKPPDRRGMAYWAAGMHQLSLGNLVEALSGFEAALGLALQAVAAPATKPDGYIRPGGDFGVILYYGYRGIGRHLLGEASGMRQFEHALAAFEETVGSQDEEAAEDAKFGLDQLRWVGLRFMGAGVGAGPQR
ncbi:MAG: hypothetical protein E6K76_00950 [Candidatus Eisenbacteria bacterium]|uniref:Tetratricopeptide repeat protein n=1 Tax=Eiseniibacteriota bacterium TaxID=2212470 RepID=A0A538TAC5_UNCEI|nr:MAG: hypothetical protein E6K76_00950 [Candidatus Eisenbacteria bacterium]